MARARKYDCSIWISLISADPFCRRDWRSRFGLYSPHVADYHLVLKQPAFERAVEKRRALECQG